MRRWGIAPKKWGARRDYDAMTLRPFGPQFYVAHYNGGPVRIEDGQDEVSYLQQVDSWHSAKWTNGFAYNGAIGSVTGRYYRGRHDNRSGAQWGHMNEICYAILFTQGAGQGEPSLRAGRMFACIVLEDPLPVISHREANAMGNDPATLCCGPDDIIPWVQRSGWVDDFGRLRVGVRSRRVLALRRRLKDLGYLRFVGNPFTRTRYGKGLARVVQEYQSDKGLIPDGVVGRLTYAALTNNKEITTRASVEHKGMGGDNG